MLMLPSLLITAAANCFRVRLLVLLFVVDAAVIAAVSPRFCLSRILPVSVL